MADPATVTVTTVLTRELLRIAIGEALGLLMEWAKAQIQFSSAAEKYGRVAEMAQGYRDMLVASEKAPAQTRKLVEQAAAEFEAYRQSFATDMAMQLPWVTQGLAEQYGIYAAVGKALIRAGVVLPFRPPGPRAKPVAKPRPPQQQDLPFETPPGGGGPPEPPGSGPPLASSASSSASSAWPLIGALVLVVVAGFAAGHS